MDIPSPFSRHFDTNYSPFEDEIPKIKNIVRSHQAIVDAIDKQIQELDDRRRLHNKFIQQHTSLLSPIKRVPTDVLSSIFHACLPRSHSLGSPSISKRHPAVVISHVCQQWRRVALGSPLLWSRLHLSTPFPPHPRYTMRNQLAVTEAAGDLYKAELAQYERQLQVTTDIAVTWISRSASCPLEIHLSWEDFTFFGPNYNGTHFSAVVDESSAVHLPSPSSITPTIVTLLVGVANRWKRVSFDLHIGSSDSELLRLLGIPSANVPQLEDLRIILSLPELYSDHRLVGEGLTSRVTLFKAPSLRSLAISRLWEPASTLPATWNTLTELYLGSTGGPGVDSQRLGIPCVLTVLKGCLNLVRCGFYIDIESRFDPSPSIDTPDPNDPLLLGQRITLPYLTSMSIQGSSFTPRFASSLNLPSLRNLFVVCYCYAPQTEDESGLVGFVDSFGDTLTEVTFDHSALTHSALIHCLERLSNVVTLRMMDTGTILHGEWNTGGSPRRAALLTDSILAKLTPRLPDSNDEASGLCYCPLLKNFSCRLTEVEFTEQGLVDFIAGRRQRNIASRLERVVVKFNMAKRTDVMKELEERGVDLEGFSAVTKYNEALAPLLRPYDEHLDHLLPEDRMVARDFWVAPNAADWWD